MESEVVSTPNRNDDDVVVDLPAPPGWMKKFTPKKGTPRRSNVFFIAPTGEKIKNPRQLKQYLKSHPENPSSPEFDWGTGDSLRRSARLSEKSKAEETPESENPKKRQRNLSSKKEAKGKKVDSEGEHETTTEKTADALERESPKKKQKKSSSEKETNGKKDDSESEDETSEVAADGNKESVEMEDAVDAVDANNQNALEINHKQVIVKEVRDKDDAKENFHIMDETETKKPENQEISDAKGVSSKSLLTVTAYPEETHKEKIVEDEHPADKDVKSSTENVVGKTNVDKIEYEDLFDAKEQGAENMSLSTPAFDKNNKEVESISLPVPAVEENKKETEKEEALTELATDEPDSEDKDAVPEVADAKAEKQIADARVG